MKHIKFIFLALPFLLLACGPKELTREEATKLLSKQYPSSFNFKIPIDDRDFLNRVTSSNLEEEGWLTIVNQSLLTTRQVIRFTEKSKPYLLAMSREDMEKHMRPVKLADTEFIEVTGIHLEDNGNSAEVEFITKCINETPFIQLFPEMPKNRNENARFKLYDDGWRVEK